MADNSIETLSNRAIQFFQAGNLAEAERVALQISALSAGNFTACYILGLASYQRGENAKALGFLERALAAEPNRAELLTLRGLVLQNCRRLDEALASFDKAIRIKPGMVEAHNNRGNILCDMGRHAEALPSYDKAASLQPRYAPTFYNRGVALQALRRWGEALQSYGKALEIQANYAEAWSNRGTVLREMKRLDQALVSFDGGLRLNPRDHAGWYNRGTILRDLKRPSEALEAFNMALAIKPDFFEALNNRGVILQQLYKFQPALADFEQALAIKPDDFDARLNQAGTLRDLNRLEEALSLAEELAAANPDSAEAWNNLGTVLHRMKRHREALESFDRALALKSGDGEALYNLGVALQGLTRHEEALAAFDSVLAAKPDFAEAMHGRGNTLWVLKGPAAALECYDRALMAKENYPEALNSRGLALAILRRPEEALASYSRALGIRPDFAEALANRGNLRWQHAKDYEGAIRDLEAALAADPDYAYARGDLLHLHMHACAWASFDHDLAIVEDGVRSGRKIVRPFIYQAIATDPSALKACSKIYADDLYPPAPGTPAKTRGGQRKIRIGYMSGEFREQATAYLAAGLYELHDKDQFDIVALDTGTDDGSPMRKRLEAAFSKMIKLSHDSDKGAAEKIAAEEIDILVNLNGYFGDGRMGICAHRPAPIQVNYLGFPATLGADYIDYIIADRVVIPENERDCYSEKIVTLPHTYQVNDNRRAVPEAGATRGEHGLPDGAFVFCNFNQSYKLTPAMFSLWIRLLKQVEDSVLWLPESNTWQSRNLRAEIARQGVAPDRIIFAPIVSPQKHLARLGLADLFLDSLPYNAHTTASDALWAGVPLLTCLGGAFPGRVAASVLEAAGMPELITRNLAEYEALTLALAQGKDRLLSLRRRLGQNRGTSPLFNTDVYRLNLESAYRTMWELHQKGEGPLDFAVRPLV
jgi:protein O-GlcNAc transferase